ncbi:hypothetical protein DYU05_02770 [Mucilaginibacter terrenus]|uniref:Uncharacterized protein n=1 Tax=Mucilaginibacter terrenus TaxID=2482727 RepID=A0A3E2NUB1_9SPHI|nr:hypothetical protein [Mucilaginibacter terrenus]RFZ84559.1 hypothetical protein DYU05_02770 [Mucilaginibacter terrenus]
MIKQILTITVFLTSVRSAAYAQIIFDVKGKTMEYVKTFEKAAKSTPVFLENTYLNAPGVGQPVVYLREEKLLPNVLVYYFPNTRDSTINYILYELDESNFGKDQQAIKRPVEDLLPFIDRYKKFLTQAQAIFGPGESSGSLDDTSAIESGRFKRTDKFSKDGVEVEMYIVLSNKQETNGIVSITPTHRLRVYVRNKRAGRSLQ